MTDTPRLPDPLDPLDELASAYLDGEVTAEERRRVERDAELTARVARLRRVAAAVAAPIAGATAPERRDAAVAAAIAAGLAPTGAPTSGPTGAPTGEPLGTSRRVTRPAARRSLGARAAAVAMVVALAGVVGAALATRDPGGDSPTAAEAARSDPMLDATAGASGNAPYVGDPEPDDDTGARASAPEVGFAAQEALVDVARSRLDPAAADLGTIGRDAQERAAAGGDPGTLPGAGCAVVGSGPLAGATGTRAGEPATAFVVDREGERRVVVVSPVTCDVVDDAPVP